MPIFSPSQGNSHPTRLLLNRHCPVGLNCMPELQNPLTLHQRLYLDCRVEKAKAISTSTPLANRRKGIWPADFSSWSPVSAAARGRRPPVCHQGAQHPLSWHRHWKQAMQLAGPPRKSDFHSFHGFSLEPAHSPARFIHFKTVSSSLMLTVSLHLISDLGMLLDSGQVSKRAFQRHQPNPSCSSSAKLRKPGP